jgi:hypothetical protein
VDQSVGNGIVEDSTNCLISFIRKFGGARSEDGLMVKSEIEHSCVQSGQ